jgi:hypothetical protein
MWLTPILPAAQQQSGKGQWQLVSDAGATSTSVLATSIASNSFAVSVGQLIVVGVGWETGDTTTVITDSAGNSYTGLTTYSSSNNQWIKSYYTVATAGSSSNILTAVFGSSVGYRNLWIQVFQPPSGTVVLSSSTGGEATNVASFSTTVSPSFTGSGLLVFTAKIFNNGVYTPAEIGWQQSPTTFSNYGISQFRNVSDNSTVAVGVKRSTTATTQHTYTVLNFYSVPTPTASGDVNTTNWKTSSTALNATFYGMIDEPVADDTDFVISPSVLGIIPKVEKKYFRELNNIASYTFNIDPVGVGNTLILIFEITSNRTLTSITDNRSNIYVLDHIGNNYRNFGSDPLAAVVFYRCSNIVNSPTSITLNWSGVVNQRVNILEVSGLDNTNPVDSIYRDTSAPFRITVSKTFVTNNNNCLAINAIHNANGSQVINTTSDWEQNTYATLYDETKVIYKNNVGPAGSKTVSYTFKIAANEVANIVTYRPAQPEPLVFNLGTSLAAGNYVIRFRATKDMPDAKVRLVLTDGVNDLGVSSWTTITTADNYTLYEVPVKISGTCDKIKIEAARLAEIDATTLLVSGI